MSNLYVRESYVNATKGHRFGDSEWYESYTDSKGQLYRSLVAEYGRCMGKVYVDRPGAPPLAIGWVFNKRMQYDDCRETYLREVWVEISEQARPR